jgi:hypothetical protein
MKPLSINTAALLLLISALAFVGSLVITLVYGSYVPIRYGEPAAAPKAGQVFTQAEMDKAEMDAKARMEARSKQFKNEPLSKHIHDFAGHAIWFVWIPWLFVPFATRVATPIAVLLLLSVPIAAVLFRLVPIEVLLAMALANALGYFVEGLMASRKHAT